ncbi:spore photoproduct lyase family protein [Paramaledivibacter caminithermalis]|jgi:spore photoproduct lyase|uniref:Uncharacterized protein n=1 Tax=Paramaledivibacter caminithermalis (strain DSM 15212 / CIP 107654 / DViRD3) TaxID=1121301 RepID=A0A1M6KRN2_PARC5|nr:hypothetical protein [Paramaledivibacter caminithermalis]SHJ61615.1 hypothetical protein SAMN02745912_00502 [Paramaledivibacter caminithermalis DSM 15212]
MKPLVPDRVYFEPLALEYPLNQKTYNYCEKNNIEILNTTSHNQVRDMLGKNEKAKFAAAKKTLIVGTDKGTRRVRFKFQVASTRSFIISFKRKQFVPIFYW